MTKKKNDDVTFVRVTNKDIWADIQKIHQKVNDIHDLAKETNGKVKMHQKMLFAVGPVILTVIGWLILVTIHCT